MMSFADSSTDLAMLELTEQPGGVTIPIRAVPGLFLYPRASLGYLAYIVSASGQRDTSHGLQVAPEFGVKYVLRRRWNFALEPFSLPVSVIFPRDNSGSVQSGWIIDYRINFSAGVNL